MEFSLSQSSLLEYATQCTRSKIVTGFSGNSNPTRFCGVLVLAVATASSNKKPSFVGEQSKHFTNFHSLRLAGKRGITKFEYDQNTDMGNPAA